LLERDDSSIGVCVGIGAGVEELQPCSRGVATSSSRGPACGIRLLVAALLLRRIDVQFPELGLERLGLLGRDVVALEAPCEELREGQAQKLRACFVWCEEGWGDGWVTGLFLG
jgi:hypothetical protein